MLTSIYHKMENISADLVIFWIMSKHYLEIQPSGYISYSFPIMTRYRLLYTIFMCCGWLFMSDVNKFQVPV